MPCVIRDVRSLFCIFPSFSPHPSFSPIHYHIQSTECRHSNENPYAFPTLPIFSLLPSSNTMYSLKTNTEGFFPSLFLPLLDIKSKAALKKLYYRSCENYRLNCSSWHEHFVSSRLFTNLKGQQSCSELSHPVFTVDERLVTWSMHFLGP